MGERNADRDGTGLRWRRREAFFGRVKGQRLRPRQEALFEEILPRLRLDLSAAPPADPAALFADPVRAVRLEIGFGGGEHLRHEAARHPDIGFIGVEPFVNAMAKMLAAQEAEPLGNLRLFDDDAVLLLDWLAPESLSGLDLFYADPWPKKKHFKRRFVNARNLARIHRVLKPGSLFRFASDIDTYVNWTLAHVAAARASGVGFEWTATRAADWHTPYEAWPGTRYEAKAIREGRRPAYLAFRRL